MTLNFPNQSRSYDPVNSRIAFWGADSSMEVTFFLEDEALFHLAPDTGSTEEAILGAFDAHRNRILDVARKAYTGRRTHSFILSADNFRT